MNISDNKTAKKVVEQLEVGGDKLASKVQGLLSDADTRRVVIKSQQGKELLAIPLTYGVVGGAVAALAAPQLAALTAIGGLVAKLKVQVERTGDRFVDGEVVDAAPSAAPSTEPNPMAAEPTAFTGTPSEAAVTEPEQNPTFVDTTPVTDETTEPDAGFKPERAYGEERRDDNPPHPTW